MLHGHHVRWEVTWASISGIPGTMVNNSGTQKLSTFTILSMIVQRSVTKSTHTPNHQILWSWMDARHGCSPVWCPEFMHLTLPYKDITEAQHVCQSMCLLGLIVFPLLVQGFLSFFFFFFVPELVSFWAKSSCYTPAIQNGRLHIPSCWLFCCYFFLMFARDTLDKFELSPNECF